jgi:MFS family permease
MEEPPREPSAGASAPGTARRTARGVAAAGRVTGRATGRAVSYTFRQARRATHAEGAGESGLFRLIELHAFNAAGDAAVAISLAGTLFFASPGEARGNVALFLGLTMLPFAVVAPLLGPFLDRFSHGRRWAIGVTMAVRAVLCLVMADAVAAQSMGMYPAALGVLVSSKAYGVTRAATVPRLLPEGQTLVKANSRISLAGVVGAAVSGPIAAGAALIGPAWSLRYAFLVFAGATVLAILLPARADSSLGEQPVSMTGRRARFAVPRAVVFALRSNAGLRMLSGFLTLYMAFVLRQHPLPGWEHRATLLMGLVIGSAGLGNTLGIAAGTVLRRVDPPVTVVAALVADAAAAVVAAVLYGLLTAVLLGLTAGVAQALGKLALDATIQREIPEQNRTSTFARSETLLQLSWVLGGFLAIGLTFLPKVGLLAPVGLGVLAAVVGAWTALVLLNRPQPAASTG